MRTFATCFCFLTLGHIAFAETDYVGSSAQEKFEAAQLKFREANSAALVTIRNEEQKLSKHREELESLQQQLAALGSDETFTTEYWKKKGFYELPTAKIKLLPQRDALKKEIYKMNLRITEAERNHTVAKDRLREAHQAFSADSTSAKSEGDKYTHLEAQLTALGTNQSFSNLRLSVKDTEIQLEALERVFDRAAVGEYLRSKMTDLLNSGVMCEASKACAQGKKPNISRDTVDDQVFPSGDSALRGPKAKSGATQR